MKRRYRHTRSAVALVALGMLLAPAVTMGDGLSASAEVNFSSGTVTLTDATGRSTTTGETLLPQRYRLSIDKQLYPFVAINATGLYQWTPTWIATDGANVEASANRWNIFASLILGPPVLNVIPYYIRRQEYATSSGEGLSTRSPTIVNQGYGFYAGWTPAGLPLLTLQVGRNENFDSVRLFESLTTDQVVLGLSYLEVKNLSVQYSLRWARADDAINHVQSSDLTQAAQVTWSGSFWDQRLSTSVNYTTALRLAQVNAAGGGTVSLQQFPVQGLSIVETFPSTPSQGPLQPNAAVIDGDLLVSAGIDIGYGPSLAGDQNYRDVGVGFVNSTTEVNVLRLWVDRQLPPAVVGAYAFTAWGSDDNLTWTQIPITGPVTFGVFDNRFEIPIPRTRSRFLKVVTRPLSFSVTVDPRYAAVLVTELQAWIVVPASEAPASSQQYSGNFTGSARLLLLRDWNLAYMLSASTLHQDSTWFQDWSVLNSVTASKVLAPGIAVNGLVSRTDSAQTNIPHSAVNRWSAQVSYDPFPTIGTSVTYSGLLGQFEGGVAVSNALTVVGRLDPLQGVSLAATGNFNWTRDVLGKRLATPGGSLAITLTPLKVLSLNGTWSITSNPVFTTSGTLVSQTQNSLTGNVAFTPVRAIYLSAGITRSSYMDQQDQTLVNFGAGFSPFPGGQLLIRFGYDENYDTTSRVRNRLFGPSVRWTVRSGTYLDVAYNWNDSMQPALLTQGRSLFATLFVSLQ